MNTTLIIITIILLCCCIILISLLKKALNTNYRNPIRITTIREHYGGHSLKIRFTYNNGLYYLMITKEQYDKAVTEDRVHNIVYSLKDNWFRLN
jgi:hypothetical protein